MNTESHCLGIEIGGTKLQACIGTAAGEILHTERHIMSKGADADTILAWFEEILPGLLGDFAARGGRPEAIGVGFGGPVDSDHGTVLTSHQVSGWNGVNLRAWFHERTGGIPVVVANDANAAGWAEYRRGAGKGARSFVYSNIGSGIGGAIVLEGRLHDGQGHGAAEFGHTIAPDFAADSPNAFDRLENLCSGWAIEERLHAFEYIDPALPLGQLCGGDASQLSCRDLAAAAQAGDPIALAEVDRVARTVGFAIANAITLLAPEVVAIGGGVSLIGEPLFAPLRDAVNDFVFPPYRKTYRIEQAALGEQVVLVGALLLAGESG